MVVRAQQVYHCRKPQVDEASEALQNEVRRTIAIGVSRTGKKHNGRVVSYNGPIQGEMKNNNAIARVTGGSTERARLAVKKEGWD